MAPLESSLLPSGEGTGGWPRGPRGQPFPSMYSSLSLIWLFPPKPSPQHQSSSASLPPVIVLSSSSLGMLRAGSPVMEMRPKTSQG